MKSPVKASVFLQKALVSANQHLPSEASAFLNVKEANGLGSFLLSSALPYRCSSAEPPHGSQGGENWPSK